MDLTWVEFKQKYLMKPQENKQKDLKFSQKQALKESEDIDWRENRMVSEVKD
jgi:hypothetical protein